MVCWEGREGENVLIKTCARLNCEDLKQMPPVRQVPRATASPPYGKHGCCAGGKMISSVALTTMTRSTWPSTPWWRQSGTTCSPSSQGSTLPTVSGSASATATQCKQQRGCGRAAASLTPGQEKLRHIGQVVVPQK